MTASDDNKCCPLTDSKRHPLEDTANEPEATRRIADLVNRTCTEVVAGPPIGIVHHLIHGCNVALALRSYPPFAIDPEMLAVEAHEREASPYLVAYLKASHIECGFEVGHCCCTHPLHDQIPSETVATDITDLGRPLSFAELFADEPEYANPPLSLSERVAYYLGDLDWPFGKLLAGNWPDSIAETCDTIFQGISGTLHWRGYRWILRAYRDGSLNCPLLAVEIHQASDEVTYPLGIAYLWPNVGYSGKYGQGFDVTGQPSAMDQVGSGGSLPVVK